MIPWPLPARRSHQIPLASLLMTESEVEKILALDPTPEDLLGDPCVGAVPRWPCPAGPLTSPSKNEHHLRSAFCPADGASGAEKDRSPGQASSASEVLLAGQARAAAGMASAAGQNLGPVLPFSHTPIAAYSVKI